MPAIPISSCSRPSLQGVVIAAVGPKLEKQRPGGQNVEIATCEPGNGELSLVVWERGAGVTLACGSGSVAAAAALHSAGISADRVLVHNPGGTAEVTLTGDDPLAVVATLAGPARRVARIQVEPAGLGESQAAGVAPEMVTTTLIDRRFREKIVLVGMVAWPRTVRGGRGEPRRARPARRHRRCRRSGPRRAAA